MKTYSSLDAMWWEICASLQRAPKVESRDGDCYETLGYVARLSDTKSNFLFNEQRLASPIYAAAEILWYFGGSRHIGMIEHYAPQYKRFADEHGQAHGAYGARWRQHNQLENAIKILTVRPLSRQVVVTCWRPSDIETAWVSPKLDVPCTLSLQFILREDQLNLVVTMRSNDVWLGMPYDVFAFTTIQQIIAMSLGVRCGWYQHQVGSMHLYERNFKAAQNIGPWISPQIEYSPDSKFSNTNNFTDSLDVVRSAVRQEHQFRTFNDLVAEVDQFGERTLISTLLGLCEAQDIDPRPELIEKNLFEHLLKVKAKKKK